MSLKKQVREKVVELVNKRIFDDLVDIATNDLETASKIYAMYRLKGLSIDRVDVERLERQGWSIDDIEFEVDFNVVQSALSGPYVHYYINVIAPNGATGFVIIETEPPEEADMDKETWKKYVRLKEEFKQKAASRILSKLQEKLEECKKKLEEYEEKLEKYKEKLEDCGCEGGEEA